MFRKEEAPAGGLIPREETSQAEASGMAMLIPSHNDRPLVIRPKEEARKTRASLLGCRPRSAARRPALPRCADKTRRANWFRPFRGLFLLEKRMPNWRHEYRRCDNCRGEYRPQREAQSYCSRRCKRDASYTRERLLKGGPRSVRKRRLARVAPGTVRNGPFSSTKSEPSRAPKPVDFGALVREQVLFRAHLENPITIFFP